MSSASYQLFFLAEGVDAGSLTPTRVTSRDEISRHSATDVDLDNYGPAPIDPSGLLRKGAQVAVVWTETGTVIRRFSGIITRVREKATKENEVQRVSVRIESPLHYLQISSDSRINQQMTTKDIVSGLLDRIGLSSFVEWRLSGSYKPREVCTQHGETSFAFLSRLLEDDGIFYYQQQKEDGKLIFGDSSSAFDPVLGDPEVLVASASGLLPDESVASLREVKGVRPSKVTLRDHDFKKPSLDVTGSAEQASVFARELYSYPGGFLTPPDGKAKAQLRVDALQTQANGVVGSGQIFRLAAGHTFKLSEPVIGAAGDEWLVHWVEQVWSQGTQTKASVLETRFRIVNKTQVFRPSMITPKPSVFGPTRRLSPALREKRFTATTSEESRSNSPGTVGVITTKSPPAGCASVKCTPAGP